jgi:hypothetical protein
MQQHLIALKPREARMVDITFFAFTTTEQPDGPLPALRSVPVPPRSGTAAARKGTKLATSPFHGYFLGWYGNTALQQLSEARRAAAAERRALYRVDVIVDGIDYAPSQQVKSHFKQLGVVHVDLLPLAVRELFCERLEIPPSRTRTRESDVISAFLWKHPDRLARIWKIPGLAHLNAVIFSRFDDDRRVTYGAIHPRRIKAKRVVNYSPDIDLPLEV